MISNVQLHLFLLKLIKLYKQLQFISFSFFTWHLSVRDSWTDFCELRKLEIKSDGRRARQEFEEWSGLYQVIKTKQSFQVFRRLVTAEATLFKFLLLNQWGKNFRELRIRHTKCLDIRTGVFLFLPPNTNLYNQTCDK